MKSLRFLDRSSGYSLASIGLLLGMVVPTLVPAFASAGTVTTRSITMSTATISATANYKLTFTPATSTTDATGGFYVDFCSNTPLIDTSCTAPTGLNAASATASAGTITAATNSLKLVTALTAATPFTVIFSGITNPSSVGTFYARVITYTNTAQFSNHTSTAVAGTHLDDGSVALSTSNEIGVTAYVLESMTFCVSGSDPGKNCATGVTSPSMTIGETVGSVTALSATAVSTKNAYAQLSTNASSGAVVDMKSNATTCGGLYRNGLVANCNIPPQTTAASSITAGTANFGVQVGTVTNPTDAVAADMAGTLTQSGSYSNNKYFMDWVSGDASGVTGPYGSALFNTSGAPVSNKNIPLTFAATISNNTPAGVYGAKLSLIATGTF